MRKLNDKEIMQMHTDAGRAGDTLMAAICEMAIVGEVYSETWETLSERERVKFNSQFFTHELAHAECASVTQVLQSY